MPKHGDVVLIHWIDIQSDSNWTDLDTLKPSQCVSVGFFDGLFIEDDVSFYRLFSGFNDCEETGDRIAIPVGVVNKPITILVHNARKEHSSPEGL